MESKETGIIIQTFLALLLLFVVLILILFLNNAGYAWHIVALWGIVALTGGVAVGSIASFINKSIGIVMACIAGFFFVIVIGLQLQLIPLCGDAVCTAQECKSGCTKDCTPATCQNTVCEIPLERCDSSKDCLCTPEYACAPNRNMNGLQSDKQGCFKISCGDGFCDGQESHMNCCIDCMCPDNFNCENNICYFQPPKISFTKKILDNEISATTFAGNPTLTNNSGHPLALIGMKLSTTAIIKDVVVTFTLPGFFSSNVPAGYIKPHEEIPVLWFAPMSDRFIMATEDLALNISIVIHYTDTQGDRWNRSSYIPFTIKNRNILDEHGHVILFITKDVHMRGDTPQEIWNEIRSSVEITKKNNKTLLQFPAETLSSHEGSANDVAILLASAYDTAGFKPNIVENDEKYFVRVKLKDRFVILDPSKIKEDFTNALAVEPGYAVYDIGMLRKQRNFTIIQLEE